ncbi:hypothetical protein HanPSC8_Chr02g0079921 [Helianthus annuus]|nr:hypothetical protein HanPSC8_Chr02g0079921 [Helianthus annuus]
MKHLILIWSSGNLCSLLIDDGDVRVQLQNFNSKTLIIGHLVDSKDCVMGLVTN